MDTCVLKHEANSYQLALRKITILGFQPDLPTNTRVGLEGRKKKQC